MQEKPFPLIQVVAGALIREDGHYLLGSRPEGKPYAGYWEFPGGKVEEGETTYQALAREFDEEMGIQVKHATPWLVKVHHYEHASVELHFFKIDQWEGVPESKEGQHFAWQNPLHNNVEPMLPANFNILRTMSLPSHINWLIDDFSALPLKPAAGSVYVLDTAPSKLAALPLREYLTICQEAESKLFALVHDVAQLESIQSVSGFILSTDLMHKMIVKPDHEWVGAIVINEADLVQANALGLDFILIQIDGNDDIKWDRIARLLQDGTSVPAFAFGHLSTSDLDQALSYGAFGIVAP